MFLFLKDHGQDRWINVNHIIYFNGDHLYLTGDKMIFIDKEYRDSFKKHIQGLIKGD